MHENIYTVEVLEKSKEEFQPIPNSSDKNVKIIPSIKRFFTCKGGATAKDSTTINALYTPISSTPLMGFGHMSVYVEISCCSGYFHNRPLHFIRYLHLTSESTGVGKTKGHIEHVLLVFRRFRK